MTEKEILEHNKRRDQMIGEINFLGGEIDRLNKQHSEMEDHSKEIEILLGKIKDISEEVNRMNRMLEDRKEEIKKTESENESLISKKSFLSEEVNILNESIEKGRSENNNLISIIGKNLNMIEGQNKEMNDNILKNKSLMESNGDLIKENKDLQDKNMIIMERSLRMDEELETSRKEKEQLDLSIEGSKKQLEDIRDTNSRILSENEEISKMIITKKTELMVIENDIETKKKINPFEEREGNLSLQENLLERKKEHLREIKAQLEFSTGKTINLII